MSHLLDRPPDAGRDRDARRRNGGGTSCGYAGVVEGALDGDRGEGRRPPPSGLGVLKGSLGPSALQSLAPRQPVKFAMQLHHEVIDRPRPTQPLRTDPMSASTSLPTVVKWLPTMARNACPRSREIIAAQYDAAASRTATPGSGVRAPDASNQPPRDSLPSSTAESLYRRRRAIGVSAGPLCTRCLNCSMAQPLRSRRRLAAIRWSTARSISTGLDS